MRLALEWLARTAVPEVMKLPEINKRKRAPETDNPVGAIQRLLVQFFIVFFHVNAAPS